MISQARSPGDTVPGLLADIGLLGADVDSRLRQSAAALAAGELDDARDGSAEVLADVEQAPVIGGVLVAQVMVAVGLFWPLRRRKWPRVQAQQRAVGSESWPTDEPSSSLSIP